MAHGFSPLLRAAVVVVVGVGAAVGASELLAKPTRLTASTKRIQGTATGVVEWLKNGPPRESSGVSLKNESVVVGIVLPKLTESDGGSTVSGTVVAMDTSGKTPTEATGEVVIETPDHKSHRVKNGDVITFAAIAGGAFALTGAGGKKSEAPCPFAKDAKGVNPPKGPVIVQDNCAVTLPLPSNGDANSTTCMIADKPAKVICAKPGEVVAVPQGIGEAHGKVPIEGGSDGQSAKLEGVAIRRQFTAPPKLKVGQKAKAKLAIHDLESFRDGSGQTLTAVIRNLTPDVVSLGKGQCQTINIDPKKIGSDGMAEVLVDFTANKPGSFVIGSRIADTDAQGCAKTCTGCSGSSYFTHYAFCDDAGTVNCYGRKGQACNGGCVHRVGGPCGFWFCACSFGKCHCK